MEQSAEHVEAIKDNKDNLSKINKVRQHKRLMFPYEMVGSSGVTLTSCRRDTNEVNSVSFMPSGWKYGIVNCEVEKFIKSCSKWWRYFIQWLIHKRENAVKDFKTECEWKRQYSNHEDKLNVKNNDNEYDVYEKDKTNSRRKMIKHAWK